MTARAFTPTPWHDHHEKRHVYGHSFNVAATLTKDEDLALILAISPHPASRYDGVATLSTIARLLGIYPEAKETYLLADAASDNVDSPAFFRALGLKPVIPLREPGKDGFKIADIPCNPKGVPLCEAGHPMHPYGTVGGRQRWICAQYVLSSGVPPHDECRKPGMRTVSFRPQDNHRLVSSVHRGSNTFRDLYKQRTVIERTIFKPALSDSGLDRTRVQSRGRMAFDLMLEGLLGYARAFSKGNPIPNAA